MIIERAYAKINLGLEVGALRTDGYHDMNTIMVPIDLYDELTFEETDFGIILMDNTEIKTEDNFVYKAAKLFMDEYGIEKGIIIKLDKKIPTEAGLGGGSSDAAATLRGLNRLFNTQKSLDELAVLAKKLGSDMPYCVYSRAAYCTGRGEIVKPLDIKVMPRDILLIKPPFGLSTKDVYSRKQFKTVGMHDEEFKTITVALETGSFDELKRGLFNDLEEPAFELIPDLQEIKSILLELGYTCIMSGSGTTICAFDENNDFSRLDGRFKFYTVFRTRLLEQ